jgi:hypothetical protein
LGWWLLPTIISAVVLLIVRFNRFHVMESTAIAAGPTKGHPLASLIASMRTQLLETAGRSAHLGAWHGPGSRLPSEILLAVGVALCWSRLGRLTKILAAQILTLVAALWLASLFTIAAANLHFGAVCCDQHEALRRCWIVVSVAGMGMLSSNWIGRGRLQRYAASGVLTQVLLCAAVLSAWHIRPVLRTYRNYSAINRATDRNFQAGFRTGDKQMVFLLVTDGLVSQPQIEPGTYTMSPENPRDVHYVLMYFKKSSMVVRPSN